MVQQEGCCGPAEALIGYWVTLGVPTPSPSGLALGLEHWARCPCPRPQSGMQLVSSLLLHSLQPFRVPPQVETDSVGHPSCARVSSS